MSRTKIERRYRKMQADAKAFGAELLTEESIFIDDLLVHGVSGLCRFVEVPGRRPNLPSDVFAHALSSLM